MGRRGRTYRLIKTNQSFQPKRRISSDCMLRQRFLTFLRYSNLTCEIEIQSLLNKGAIVPTDHEKGDYYSSVFTTPKKDGSSRMILNLTGLNKFLEYRHFKMESLTTVVNMVKRNCFMASVDLKWGAYYSVAIAQEHQKYCT